MAKQTSIYKVQFSRAPLSDGKRDFYFSCIAAIFDTFSTEQIGTDVKGLWGLRLTQGNTYIGANCTITKEVLTSKAQANPHATKESENAKK